MRGVVSCTGDDARTRFGLGGDGEAHRLLLWTGRGEALVVPGGPDVGVDDAAEADLRPRGKSCSAGRSAVPGLPEAQYGFVMKTRYAEASLKVKGNGVVPPAVTETGESPGSAASHTATSFAPKK